MDELRIRPATEGDLPAVMRLFHELASLQEPWRVFTPRPNLSEEMRRRYQADVADPDALLVVAELNGEIVGMAAGHLHKPSSMSEELAVELGSVYVRREHRERGVAGALTAQVAQFARERGVQRITLKTFAQNEEALLAWQRLGFEPRMVQLTAPVERLQRVDSPARGRAES
ncbi:MAG TPA: GNAT family N-acetyltransferase [Actinomycetota bacterium]|jgi:ribosomal protein S18 acetylase RimI-like enzyme